MDELSRNHLNAIVLKRDDELTEDEKAFLRARKTYLTRTQLLDYINILDQTPEGTENKNEPSETNTRRVRATRTTGHRRGRKAK